jgi:hypothetical protein
MSTNSVALSARRIAAMALRHYYLLRSSWPRLLEIVYWPAVQMTMWGFLQLGFARQTGAIAFTVSTFLAAFLLWDILFRGQLGFSMSFLEEMWSRNLPNLMISPLRPYEFVLALILMGTVRMAIGLIPVTFLAIAFFGFNFWSLGLALVAFFANLLFTSWSVGMLCAADRLGAAADRRVRRHARAGARPRVPRRPDAVGDDAECGVARSRVGRVHAVAQQRAPRRVADSGWRIALDIPYLRHANH